MYIIAFHLCKDTTIERISKDISFGINPVSGRYTAETGIGGTAAALTNLASYSHQQIRIESEEIPLGTDIGQTQYAIFPPYRSGYKLEVSIEATKYIRGRIVSPDSDPIALSAGRIYPENSGSASEQGNVTFFTNREGMFEAYGILPGNYALELFAFPNADISFTIEEDDRVFQDLGEIRIAPPEGEEDETQ
ncbi:MAG: hypothetical protein ACLFR1_02810 [Spirochaetia bacterium]